jgi:hypothetical protein
VNNGTLTATGAQQAMQYQNALTTQWQQILLQQGGGQIDPGQWAAIQGMISRQVQQYVAQLGGQGGG